MEGVVVDVCCFDWLMLSSLGTVEGGWKRAVAVCAVCDWLVCRACSWCVCFLIG